jgi:Protein of unknown function (DUF4235)
MADTLHQMKLLYKPFALFFGVLGTRLGKSTFRSLWARIDKNEPPKPTTEQASFAKVVGAASLEAATMAGAAAAADRAAARTFHYFTGYWPAKKPNKDRKKDKKDRIKSD